jgi:hypothetical protein
MTSTVLNRSVRVQAEALAHARALALPATHAPRQAVKRTQCASGCSATNLPSQPLVACRRGSVRPVRSRMSTVVHEPCSLTSGSSGRPELKMAAVSEVISRHSMLVAHLWTIDRTEPDRSVGWDDNQILANCPQESSEAARVRPLWGIGFERTGDDGRGQIRH